MQNLEIQKPHLGLVGMTKSDRIRYRTITRARLVTLSQDAAEEALRNIYIHNTSILDDALSFCLENNIVIYRLPSIIYPFYDTPLGAMLLKELAKKISYIGKRSISLGIRLISHPDQYVVLSSLSADIVENGRRILKSEASFFDMLGLPRSPWACMIIHGGKSGRDFALIKEIRRLPVSVRSRIVLENDEYSYSAKQIYDICLAVNIPMIFDAHHHIVCEQLSSYEDDSVGFWLDKASKTWPDSSWQVTHLSNGSASFGDRKHSEYITKVPSSFLRAPWIEVEAKGKDEALLDLRKKTGWD